jgi:16S rRNA (cytidine1402-2'-O)-methyltransferase
LQELQLEELNEHTRADALDRLLAPLRAGHDVGLLSEAGCPAVADPGANLVALAQQEDIRIVPLIGPSSLLLALMASGLNGQRFAFQGYLPAKDAERSKALRDLERIPKARANADLHRDALPQPGDVRCNPASLPARNPADGGDRPDLPGESVSTRTIQQWKKQTPPEIERRPTVFLLLA